jgi:hypothetical protein
MSIKESNDMRIKASNDVFNNDVDTVIKNENVPFFSYYYGDKTPVYKAPVFEQNEEDDPKGPPHLGDESHKRTDEIFASIYEDINKNKDKERLQAPINSDKPVEGGRSKQRRTKRKTLIRKKSIRRKKTNKRKTIRRR